MFGSFGNGEVVELVKYTAPATGLRLAQEPLKHVGIRFSNRLCRTQLAAIRDMGTDLRVVEERMELSNTN